MCPIQKFYLIRVSGTYISLDQIARYWNYSWSEFLVQTLPLNIGSYQKYSWPESPINIFLLISVPDTESTPDQSLRYIYFSWSNCPIPKLLLIRVSGANITLDYRVLSKILLTRVSDKYISLDQRSRYRNYSWSEFLVQTLPLNIGSYQKYSWPESPINIFLLISVPDTESTPDQSLRYIYFSWSNCPIPKLLLIRVSGANITLDYRVRSKFTLIRVSNIDFSWSVCPIPKLLLIRVSGANIILDYRVQSYLLLATVSDTITSLDQFARYRNCSWLEFLV